MLFTIQHSSKDTERHSCVYLLSFSAVEFDFLVVFVHFTEQEYADYTSRPCTAYTVLCIIDIEFRPGNKKASIDVIAQVHIMNSSMTHRPL